MGSAFTAVADDATAVFWNPAGLPQIGHQEISGTHANLYDAEIKDNFVVFALPISERVAVAADWYHSGFEDAELRFGENRFDLSAAWRPRRHFSFGLTAKYFTRDIALDESTVRQGSGQGIDVGVLAAPVAGLRVGLAVQDLFDSEVEYDGAGSSIAFPQATRFGASYQFGELGTVALDIDDRVHLGGEYVGLKPVALRAGMEIDRSGEDDPTYTMGLGAKVGVLRFDVAQVIHPVLDATTHVGLSLAFSFNPAQVRIESVETSDLFVSQYKSYASRPVGVAIVRNMQDRPLATKVSTFIQGLMDAPTEQDVVLRPNVVQEVPLIAVLSNQAMEEPADRVVQWQVAATYASQRLPRTEKKIARAVAYGPGAIDWEKGVAQAAAFVTSRDAAIEELARRAVSLGGEAFDDAYQPNIHFAATIFDAVEVLGVTYVSDPHNPYASISTTTRAVDTVLYPRQTLAQKTGDCDDTTVLMAALLGNVGIESQIVDVPGHLFLMFDSGLHEQHRLALSMSEDLYVIEDGRVWIPIETTALGRGFAEAWREGAEAYRGWKSRGRLSLVSVSAAQTEFPPADLPGEPAPAAELDVSRFQALLDHDSQTLRGWSDDYIATRFVDVRENTTPSESALNELARVQFLGGDIEGAKRELQRLLASNASSASANNNAAVIEIAEGSPETALQFLSVALESDRNDPGIRLNLGLVFYAAGDSVQAWRLLDRAVQDCGGLESAAALLGAKVGPIHDRGQGTAITNEEVVELLQKALLAVPESFADETIAAPDSTSIYPTPNQPMRLQVAATRGVQIQRLHELMYWKE
jgi:tetratricopeptide (TPR) repeat protein